MSNCTSCTLQSLDAKTVLPRCDGYDHFKAQGWYYKKLSPNIELHSIGIIAISRECLERKKQSTRRFNKLIY